MTINSTEHLPDEILAAYLDGALSSSEQGAAETHFADCRACRGRLLRASEAVTNRNPRSRRLPLASGVAVAAAAVAVVFFNVPDPAPEPPTLRNGQVDAAVIAVVQPPLGAEVVSPVRFVWHSFRPDLRYRFTITTTEGIEVWTTDTTDTVLVQPQNVELMDGDTYLWYVDALLADGSSISTGVSDLTLRR
jgi:hypothetical protein